MCLHVLTQLLHWGFSKHSIVTRARRQSTCLLLRMAVLPACVVMLITGRVLGWLRECSDVKSACSTTKSALHEHVCCVAVC